jgi:hypothetical protein
MDQWHQASLAGNDGPFLARSMPDALLIDQARDNSKLSTSMPEQTEKWLTK